MALENSVRSCRRAMSLTQVALAEILGISRQTVIAIENGRYNPSLELALRMARVFERPVEEIFLLPSGLQPG